MSDRHQRIESLLRELVASFLSVEANPNPLITVTHISSSPDYRNATVYFTTIPEDKEQDALIFMKRSGSHLRQYIKKHSDLKIIPNLTFLIDGGERARQKMDDLINGQ